MENRFDLDGHWGPARLFAEAGLGDPRQVRDWCMGVGLLRGQSVCRRHRELRTLRERSGRDGSFWYCRKCDKQVAITKDSIFEDANLPPAKLVMLALSYAHGDSYVSTARNCIFSREDGLVPNSTIARWFEYFREIVLEKCLSSGLEHGGMVGGPGVVVQIDEAQIGRRKYNRGRVYEDTWVFGAIDDHGKLRLEICDKRNKVTLHSLVQKHVHPGSVIHSDSWKAYNGLDKLGYAHSTVNHSKEFVAEDGTHTQRIEAQWRAVRRYFCPGGRRHANMADYLVEYMWRRKCLVKGTDPFKSLIMMLKSE